MGGKRRTIKKHMYRGYEMENLISLTKEEIMLLLTARMRRRLNRGLKRPHRNFLAKVKKSLKAIHGMTGVKPKIIKTHLRNMPILPDLIGAQIGCHNGRGFVLVEVKPGMVGNYLGEHAITYKPVKHGHVCKNFNSRFMQLIQEGKAVLHVLRENPKYFG